jgi:hypothetical protein
MNPDFYTHFIAHRFAHTGMLMQIEFVILYSPLIRRIMDSMLRSFLVIFTFIINGKGFFFYPQQQIV